MGCIVSHPNLFVFSDTDRAPTPRHSSANRNRNNYKRLTSRTNTGYRTDSSARLADGRPCAPRLFLSCCTPRDDTTAIAHRAVMEPTSGHARFQRVLCCGPFCILAGRRPLHAILAGVILLGARRRHGVSRGAQARMPVLLGDAERARFAAPMFLKRFFGQAAQFFGGARQRFLPGGFVLQGL